jgi:hypothetical protein
MHRHRAVPLVVIAAAGLLSACDAVGGGASGNPVGVAQLDTRTKGAGFTTGPIIAFYRLTGATFLSALTVYDTCFTAPYTATSTTPTSDATTLSGGAYVAIQIGNAKDTLRRAASGTDATYRSSLTSGLSFTPGDSVFVTIVGDANGFPPAIFRGRTAEPFTLNAPTYGVAGDPITATWTAATDPNSAMFLTFRYATGGATAFNRQIACSFIDDGSGTVQGFLGSDWINSPLHDVIAERVRTIVDGVQVPKSYFNLVSVFDVPTPTSP